MDLCSLRAHTTPKVLSSPLSYSSDYSQIHLPNLYTAAYIGRKGFYPANYRAVFYSQTSITIQPRRPRFGDHFELPPLYLYLMSISNFSRVD